MGGIGCRTDCVVPVMLLYAYACSLPHLVLHHHYHFSHAAEVQVTSATEFIVWGGHFYAGTGTKCVEKRDMKGAPTEQSLNLFLKLITLFA